MTRVVVLEGSIKKLVSKCIKTPAQHIEHILKVKNSIRKLIGSSEKALLKHVLLAYT